MSAEPFPPKTVAVHPAGGLPVIRPLLEVLATLFPVRFVPHPEALAAADGLHSLAADAAVADRLRRRVSA